MPEKNIRYTVGFIKPLMSFQNQISKMAFSLKLFLSGIIFATISKNSGKRGFNMFSVIIPTKSSDTFSLNRAVKSLSLQQIDEIIIVFDGPVDTLQVSDLKFEPKNKCLKFLSSGNCTQGPGVARQVGVDNAKGEYILFLDSDDEYKKGSIENLEKHICDNNRPDIIVMDCLLKAGENENYRVDLPFFQNNSKQALLKHMFEKYYPFLH